MRRDRRNRKPAAGCDAAKATAPGTVRSSAGAPAERRISDRNWSRRAAAALPRRAQHPFREVGHGQSGASLRRRCASAAGRLSPDRRLPTERTPSTPGQCAWLFARTPCSPGRGGRDRHPLREWATRSASRSRRDSLIAQIDRFGRRIAHRVVMPWRQPVGLAVSEPGAAQVRSPSPRSRIWRSRSR